MLLSTLLTGNPVVPVAVFRNAEDAVRVSEILLENSITVIEITLRTAAAYSCIKEVSRKLPDMSVGAGSILSADAMEKAQQHGAGFGVSPCLDPGMVMKAESLSLPYIPGISTPSELCLALKTSRVIKLFPAGQLGGVEYLKAITAPFRMQEFHLIPTGGVNNTNFLQYLATDKVIACGMTYPVESGLIEKGDYASIAERIRSLARALSDRASD